MSRRARRLARMGREAVARRARMEWRKPPQIKLTPRVSENPTVYYLAPDETSPSGGVRVIYRHVDLLNEMGVHAAVLHTRPNLDLVWFSHATRVESVRTLDFMRNDVLVVPEFYGPFLHTLPDSMSKVVFNQGAYHTFDDIDLAATNPGHPYSGLSNLRAVMTVSEDSRRLLQLAFPNLPIDVVRNLVDPRVFSPGTSPRRRAVAYVPTRRAHELGQLLHILRSRGFDWDLIPIRGMSESEVAGVFRSVLVFMSLSDQDGFGLPPAEAMASGCYVVGYAGGGGDEFFDPEYCSPTSSLAELVEVLVRTSHMPLHQIEQLGQKASHAVLQRYSEAGMREDLRRFWGPILGRDLDPWGIDVGRIATHSERGGPQ